MIQSLVLQILQITIFRSFLYASVLLPAGWGLFNIIKKKAKENNREFYFINCPVARRILNILCISVLFSMTKEIHKSIGRYPVNGRVCMKRSEIVLLLGNKQSADRFICL